MRSAECGMSTRASLGDRPFIATPHSAFHTPHYLGTAGIVSVTLCAGASLGCPGEKRPPHRPVAVDRRAPPAPDRRGGAGDPLPPVARLRDRRASVSGRAHGDRPHRATG